MEQLMSLWNSNPHPIMFVGGVVATILLGKGVSWCLSGKPREMGVKQKVFQKVMTALSDPGNWSYNDRTGVLIYQINPTTQLRMSMGDLSDLVFVFPKNDIKEFAEPLTSAHFTKREWKKIKAAHSKLILDRENVKVDAKFGTIVSHFGLNQNSNG